MPPIRLAKMGILTREGVWKCWYEWDVLLSFRVWSCYTPVWTV